MIKKTSAVFLDRASLHPDDLDFSSLNDVADWQWFDNINLGENQHVLATAGIVVTNKVVIDRQFIENSPQLKLICVAATGFNNIDVAAAKEQGIAVCNVRAYATPAVTQHVFSLLLSLVTSSKKYQDDVVNGGWSNSEFFCLLDYPVRELQGMTLGIVGYGELGRSVAKVAACFGMRVLIAKRDADDKRAGRLPLAELLPQVDVLSLHCPLTESTQGLIGEAEIARMKDDAIVINTARGGLVDEAALLAALRAGCLAGAGLDVLAQEPPARDNAMIRHKPDNLLITPHTAWASRESRQRLLAEIADNIRAFQQGKLRNRVG